jgi:hypothetical protein
MTARITINLPGSLQLVQAILWNLSSCDECSSFITRRVKADFCDLGAFLILLDFECKVQGDRQAATRVHRSSFPSSSSMLAAFIVLLINHHGAIME